MKFPLEEERQRPGLLCGHSSPLHRVASVKAHPSVSEELASDRKHGVWVSLALEVCGGDIRSGMR